ncbi:MAG: hypothetical protein K8L99_11895 [Anaerolineae bacterium]|nr:hypothetical protein [Anaerolineae bacterium]
MTDKIARMATNNAAWIDRAVSALGIGGEFTPVLWQNIHDMPPIFPNADTLGGTEAEKMAAIEQLVAARSGKVVAIKDSWAQLDLRGLGFEILFQAQWLYRAAQPLTPTPGDLQIEPVTTAEGLRAFALACNGPDIPVEVYSPKLLNQPDIVWLAGKQDGRVVAGVTAVLADGLNGINNLFGETITQKQRMLEAAVLAFPDQPACCYERGDLALYLASGFETAGDLQVWLRPADL